MSPKIRELLNKIANISAYVAEASGDAETAKYMNDIISIVQTALSEPLRNCDVGSASEQEERYLKLKREYVDRLTRCPKEPGSYFPDSLYWAQMLYEKKENP